MRFSARPTAIMSASEESSEESTSGECAEPDVTDDEREMCEVHERDKVTKLRYVETSLDDLSYSSAGDEGEDDKTMTGNGVVFSGANKAPRSKLTIAPRTGCRLSADEEVEQRLLTQLQNEQRLKQQRAAEHQARQVARPVAQCGLKRDQEQGQELEQEDELAPEVPVRRSSQAQRPAPRFDPSQLPRPLLSGELEGGEWRTNSQRQQVASQRAKARPSQPPPPPPPPSRPRSQAPRNIWSPSTSSAVSASSSCDSLNLVAKVAPPASSSSLASNSEPSEPTPPNDDASTGSPLSTVVERRVQPAEPVTQARRSGDEQTLVYVADQSQQQQQAATEAAARSLGAANADAIARDAKRVVSESAEAQPAPPKESAGDGWRSFSVSLEQQEQLKQLKRLQQQQQQQLVSRPNLRSFSIATTTPRPKQQQQQQQLAADMESGQVEAQKYWTLPGGSSAQEGAEAAGGGLGRRPTSGAQQAASDHSNTDDDEQASRRPSADFSKFKNGQEISYELETKSYRYKERTFYEMSSDNQQQQQQQGQNHRRDGQKHEWFKQMYKQMHNKQTPEKNLLQAVNSQPDTTQITIKLKSPKSGE